MEPSRLQGRHGPLRVWLLPLGLLLGGALLVFVATYLADALLYDDPLHALGLFFDPNPQSAANTLSNAGEIVAAVLAIAITVAAIVVELAANRYTHRITELFINAPINFIVMGFFVITGLQSLWVTLIFDYHTATATGFVPRIGVGVSMVMLAACLLLLLPYFAFVFSFLNPVQILERIRNQTLRIIQARRSSQPAWRRQMEAVRGVEQIADVGLNAMENKDKGVCMASVDALRSLTIDYQDVRPALGDAWFRVEGQLAHNPDFVSMSEDVLEGVSRRRIWFEMKVLRQFQTIYNEALNRMRDINYLIAINTRRMAEHAMRSGHDELVDLVLKFFNTYLRATINARDVRTAYNVLNQYRLLAEAALGYKGGGRAVEIARYFKYYGLTAYTGGLPFILETVAYDLCTLNEIAFDRKSLAAPELLRIFLDVDKESETDVQEASLRGVRKAQVRLATYYLVKGDEKLARRVHDDMTSEQAGRLSSIRDELLSVRSREFWEVSDRGVNFDFLPPDQKVKMLEFFEWFGDMLPPRESRLPMRTSEIPIVPADAVPSSTRTETDSVHSVAGLASEPIDDDETGPPGGSA